MIPFSDSVVCRCFVVVFIIYFFVRSKAGRLTYLEMTFFLLVTSQSHGVTHQNREVSPPHRQRSFRPVVEFEALCALFHANCLCTITNFPSILWRQVGCAIIGSDGNRTLLGLGVGKDVNHGIMLL